MGDTSNICVHVENGVILASVDGHEIQNVVDYKVINSAYGEMELVLTIKAKGIQTEFEAILRSLINSSFPIAISAT